MTRPWAWLRVVFRVRNDPMNRRTMSILSRTFLVQTLERAVKTAAQSVLLAWGGGDVILDLFAIDWQIALGAAAGGALLSILTSFASEPYHQRGSPSVVSQ